MNFSDLGLKLDPGGWIFKGVVEGVNVGVCHRYGSGHRPEDGPPVTAITFNTSSALVEGHLTAEDIVVALMDYADERLEQATNLHEQWKEKHAAIHRRFDAQPG